MVSSTEFLYEVFKNKLDEALVDNNYESYKVSRNIIYEYTRTEHIYLGKRVIEVLRKIIVDFISDDEEKRNDVLPYLKTFLTDEELLESSDDIELIVKKVLYKFRRKPNLKKRTKGKDSDLERINENKLENYLGKLEKQISQNELSNFINIELTSRNFCDNKNTVRKLIEKYSIYNIFEKFQSNKVVLLGEPGAGKTTLLKELVNVCINMEEVIPIFIRMGFYRKNKTILDLFNCFDADGQFVEYFLKSGRLLVILDGINEVPGKNINEVLCDIIEFINIYPDNQYVISCRTIEFPIWALSEFNEISVLPISEVEVENQFIKLLGNENGAYFYDMFTEKSKYKRLRELFQNPLLLGMIISICKEEEIDQKFLDLNSKSDLYNKFIRKFNFHQQKKISNYVYNRLDLISEDLLCYIAYQMQYRGYVFIREFHLRNVIDEFIGNCDEIKAKQLTYDNDEVFNIIISKPQLDAFDIIDDEPLEYAFIHQSFQEYYAALYIQKTVNDGSFLCSNMEKYISDGTGKHWEFITFVNGLIEPNFDLLNYIKSRSKTNRDQTLLKLASNCIRDMKSIKSNFVNDICVRMLDAFKYWNIPFDYELIYGIHELEDYLGENFPKRVLDNINWFHEKYVQKIEPIILTNLNSINALMEYASGDDEIMAIDAVYTLGKYSRYKYKEKREVAEFLLNLVKTADSELKEFIIIALKDIADPIAVDELKRIIERKNETSKIKLHALNALGNIGQIDSAYSVIKYLNNSDNDYRDSAAWALQYIGKVAEKEDLELFKFIKRILLECYLNDSGCRDSSYARGTAVYSLGELNAMEFGDDILELLKSEKEPYVIEDAIYSLGTLRFESASNVLKEFIYHEDPIVRMKAIEALSKIEYSFTNEQYEIIKNDKYEIVSEFAEYMKFRINGYRMLNM